VKPVIFFFFPPAQIEAQLFWYFYWALLVNFASEVIYSILSFCMLLASLGEVSLPRYFVSSER
jgi:hypothetical protein